MFCTNCGTDLSNDTLFCTTCGAKVTGTKQQETETTGAAQYAVNQSGYNGTTTYTGTQYPQKGSKNKTILISLIAVAAVLILVIGVFVVKAVATPGYNKPIKYMVKGMQNGDFDVLMKAYPDFLKDEIEEELEYYTDDIDKYMKQIVDGLKEQFGNNYSVTFKIIDNQKLKSREVKELEEEIEYYYDEIIDIDEVQELEVELTIKGKNGEKKEISSFTVFKLGSRWYSMDSIIN